MISVNNQAAQVAVIQFQSNQAQRITSIERLSSGLRINSSSDGASDLSLATRLNSLIRSSDVAKRNINDGLGLLEVTDGALSEIKRNLSRMLELSVTSANGTLSDSDRLNLDLEYQEAGSSILDITANTSFNKIKTLTQGGQGVSLMVTSDSGSNRWELDLMAKYSLDGVTFAGSLESIFNQIAVFQNNLEAKPRSEEVFRDIKTQESSSQAIDVIKASQDTATSLRASIGAQQNVLSSVYENLESLQRNTQAALGRVIDADYAVEVSNLINSNIANIGAQIGFAQGLQMSRQALAVLESSNIDFQSFKRQEEESEDSDRDTDANDVDLNPGSLISESLQEPLNQNQAQPEIELPEIGPNAGFNFLETQNTDRG